MTTRNVKILAATMALGLSSLALVRPAAAQEDAIDAEMLRMKHEFQIGNGERYALHEGKEAATYRICAKQMPGDMPLKVIVDGMTHTLMDGTCETDTGKHISLSPAGKLPEDMVLLGRYHRIEQAPSV